MNFPRQIAKAFQDLLFPPLCTCCKSPLVAGEEFICLSCAMKLPKTNFHLMNDNPVMEKFKGRIAIRRAASFLYFTKQSSTQKLIHQLKYNGRPKIGIFLGKLFADTLSDNGWLHEIDQIVPVPIHPRKERARGYNQSRYIARGIAECGNLHIVPGNIITKIRHTESQTRKGNLERLENVGNVFRLTQPGFIRGKNILLVDDVLTTGATLESCALEIQKGAPESISIATIAYASEL